MKPGNLIEVYDVRNGWSPAVIVEIITSTDRADSIKVFRDGVVETTTTLWCRCPTTQIGAANNRNIYKTTSRQA